VKQGGSILTREDAFAQDTRSNNRRWDEILKKMGTNSQTRPKVNMTLMNLSTNKRFHVNEEIPQNLNPMWNDIKLLDQVTVRGVMKKNIPNTFHSKRADMQVLHSKRGYL
jgi:hypothetical protein